VRASVGWSTCPDDGENPDALVHAADLRLLSRKAQERDALQLRILRTEDEVSARA
jgi:GGDEF domain-containing protein